jgi:hypothetical protein
MTARQLVIKENSPLDFVENPNTGKIFFVCGGKKGYVSPAALEKMNGNCSLDDFQYAEVSIDGAAAVPCLMVVGNGNNNVQKSLGSELLH